MMLDPKGQVEGTMRALHIISVLLSPSTVLDMDAREELASELLSLLGRLEESLSQLAPREHCPGCLGHEHQPACENLAEPHASG
jgi:hypothetical protein